MKSVLRFIGLFLLSCSSIHAVEDQLILVGASYGKNVVALCEADGSVLWRMDTEGPKPGQRGHNGHHDIHLLPNGNILYHDSWTTVREVTLGKQLVWEYDSRKENGNAGKKVDVHAFTRLANGDTVIVESGVGRILHVNREKAITREVPLGEGGRKNTRLMRVTDKGRYLVCAERPGLVTEYAVDGTIVWEYPIDTRVYGAIRGRNGNTFICSGSGNSVLEVTPDQQVVWEIKDQIPGTPYKLGWMTTLQKLENGHLVIGNCHAGPDMPQLIELDRNRKVVWTFDEFDLVGNGLACWQILTPDQSRMVRKKLAALTTADANPR